MRKTSMLFVLVVVMAACGGNDAATTTTRGGDGTTTTAGGGGITAATTSPAAAGEMLFGDDVLAELNNRCTDGDFTACDVLYQASDFGSDYEAFADTCGGRMAPEGGYCVEAFDVSIDLSDLRTDCAGGDMLACDMLYIYSPFDSDDESFGDSCAGRGDPGLSCATAYGWTPSP